MRDYDAIAQQWARDVISGSVVAGKRIKQICARFLSELETPGPREYLPEFGVSACFFAESFRHTKGKFANSFFVLEPWQVFCYMNTFSWYYPNGRRRYRTAYIFVARKNGKSFMSAPIATYLMTADSEPGAEVYTVATKLDQARLVFEEVRKLIAQAPALRERYGLTSLYREIRGRDCVLKPLTSKHDTADGLNPHGVIADEVHAMDFGMLGVLDTACGSRDRALIFQITTAGDPSGAGFQQYQRACDVLDGMQTDDTFFPMLFELDSPDEINDETAWKKANPNLEVSLSIEYLREQVAKTGSSALERANVLTKHFNLWQSANADFVKPEELDLCAVSSLTVPTKDAIAAVDYASSFDCGSVVASWYDADGNLCAKSKNYIPEATVKAQRDTPWQRWQQGGTLEVVPGEVLDPSVIVNCLSTHFPAVSEVAYDRFLFNQSAVDLQRAGFDVIAVSQRMTIFSEPTHILARLIAQGKFRFEANDVVLRDMLCNVQIVSNKSGLIMPAKPSRGRKIDAAIALIMTIARHAARAQEREKLAAESAVRRAQFDSFLSER